MTGELRCSVCGTMISAKKCSRQRGTCGDRACLFKANERRRIADSQRRKGDR